MNVQVFFANVGLVAPFQFIFLGATVVDVAFLDFAGNTHATVATTQKAKKCFWLVFVFRRRIAPAAVKNGFNGVEQFLGNNWLVLAFMHLAGIAKMAVVNRVGQNGGNEGRPDQFTR
ncbi:MAG TPA: hypothetical protein VIK62_04140 [Verrucomicrobiae bacterium]